jgi:hypothetical protein
MGRTLLDSAFIYSSRIPPLCIFNLESKETICTTWKETSRRAQCKDLTAQALQSGQLEFNIRLYWTMWVDVS